VAQLDADGQHPPEALPELIGALHYADLVIGSRFHGPSGYTIPFLRKRGIQFLGKLATLCAGKELRDVTSGMRVWRSDALQKMVGDFPERVADANLLVRACKRGIRIQEISVPMRPRLSGRSMHASPASVLFAAEMAALCLIETFNSSNASPQYKRAPKPTTEGQSLAPAIPTEQSADP